jgi:predicted ATP-dependent serine protease
MEASLDSNPKMETLRELYELNKVSSRHEMMNPASQILNIGESRQRTRFFAENVQRTIQTINNDQITDAYTLHQAELASPPKLQTQIQPNLDYNLHGGLSRKKIYELLGECSSGKSLLLNKIVANILNNISDRTKIVYINCSEDKGSVINKFKTMGIPAETLKKRLQIFSPRKPIEFYKYLVSVADHVQAHDAKRTASKLEQQGKIDFFGNAKG